MQEHGRGDALLVSIVETQRLLGGFSRKEINSMVKRGELRSIKHGRRHMIYGASITQYVESKLAETSVSA